MEQKNPISQTFKRPALALALVFLPVLCCLLPYLISLTYQSGFFIYYRNPPMILLGESILCIGGLGALAGMVLGGIALFKNDSNKTLSILALPIGSVALLLTVAMMVFLAGISILSQ